MFTSIATAGLAVVVLGLAARAFRWISDHNTCAVLAVSQIVTSVAGFLTHNTVAASISAAAAAWFAWQWWTGGGDDDSKRRLRKVADRFRGVRRTAPAGA